MLAPYFTKNGPSPLVRRPTQFTTNGIGFGLSYLRAFDAAGVGSTRPLYSKWPQLVDWSQFLNAAVANGVWVSGPVAGGVATTSAVNSGQITEKDGSGFNNVAVSNVGSLAMFTTIGFSPTDGGNHIGLRIGQNTLGYAGIQRFTDNNWYLGWVDAAGTDFEVVAAASGTYSVGDAVVVGCAWNASTTFGYVKGIQVGTHASPGTFPSLTGASTLIQINGITGASRQWSASVNTVIYWVALWDRQLTQQDFEYLQSNPFALFTAPDIPAVARVTIPVGGLSLPTLKQSISGQNLTFLLINTTTGAPLTNATVTVKVTDDNGGQTVGGGVVTELGNGQYNYAPTQAEVSATNVGFLFSAPGAIQVNRDFHTWPVDANSLRETSVAAIGGSTLGAQGEGQAPLSVCWGTAGTGGTTTSVPVSTLNNPSQTTVSGQLIGRTLIFLGNTTTSALQSAAATITASTVGFTPTITVSGLPTTPAIGDTFVIV